MTNNIPDIAIRDLIEAGVHFGHKTMRWNPKMSPYIYGIRGDTHIIDLQQTQPLLHNALKVVYDVVKNNGRVLFVATKRQAASIAAESAKKCGQYYVNSRWLGGMLTNWNTISKSIKRLYELERLVADEQEFAKYTKKERLGMTKNLEKMEKSLGGIKNMGGKPDLIFVIDTNKENIAIKEANVLNIPVIAIVDTNCDPDGVNYVVPGNDDATRAIKLYCDLIANTALNGIQASLAESGIDIGSSDNLDEILESYKEKNAQDTKKSKPAAGGVKPIKKKAKVAPVTEEVVEAPAAEEAVEVAKPAKKAPAKKATKTEEAAE